MRSISFTTTKTGSTSDLRVRGEPVSFVIQGAGAGQARNDPSVRLDQVDSRTVIGRARMVYLQHMTRSPSAVEPLGVVLVEELAAGSSRRASEASGSAVQGRVVFECPVLLPSEIYVPLEWLKSRGPRSRGTRSSQRP
ncbi:MAG: hypothetical protein ACKOCM_04240 [Cyanobacteriota bacterium]